MSALTVADLPTASGDVLCSAVIRRERTDFQVTELLSPAEQNEGEHLWLWVEKNGANTQWVATALADHFKVRRRDVAYSGLKDRHAVTRQWFSVWLPGGQKRGDPILPTHAEFRVISWRWQAKKIRRGLHDGNRFDLLLRDVTVSNEALEARLATIKAFGVPNYYGQQRFGYSFDPQAASITWSDDRFTRGMQLSAVRSHLFNMQLAERVLANTWRVVELPGWLCWRGSNAGFIADGLDARLEGLLATGELSPSAWLPGLVDDPRLAGTPAEHASLVSHQVWVDQLVERRVLAARRATVLPVRELSYDMHADGLQLTFELPPGAFATAVLNELFAVKDEARLTVQASLNED